MTYISKILQVTIETPKQLAIQQKSELFLILRRSFSGSPSLTHVSSIVPEILSAHIKNRLCWEGQSYDEFHGLPLTDPEHYKLWEEK